MAAPSGEGGATGSALVPAGERAASAIYGTIVVTAVIVALSEDPGADANELITAAATTTIVFWLAHVYSEFLGRRAVRNSTRGEGIGPALRRDITMVEAAVPPTAALVLAAIHLVSRTNAVTIALVIGVVELFVWGYLAGRGPGSGFVRSATIGLLNCVLGVAIVLLKALIH